MSYGTVSMYIKGHKELFEGHIVRSGKIVLDDVAISILENKYLLIKPVEIIKDTTTQKALIKTQQKVIELQEQFNKVLPFLTEAKYKTNLLEAETKC